MDWKIKKGVLFIFVSFYSIAVWSQQKKEVYFNFDKQSTKRYWVATRMQLDGKMSKKIPVYRKYKEKRTGKIVFGIYGLKFVHKKKMERIIKPIDFLEKHKLLSAGESVAFIKEITSLENGGNGRFSSYEGGGEGHTKIYIVEKKDSSHVILYRVIWEPYIE